MTLGPGTTAFYDDWAANGAENPRSALSHHFTPTFRPGGRVLDVGCGKGRDVVALLDMGFDAYGTEPHPAMRAQALARDARLPTRVGDAALPDIGQPFGGGFDGVVCGAVLMHVPPAALPASLASLAAVLRPEGRLLIALPQMRADLLVDGIDPDGRAFANHAPERVRQLLAPAGLALLAATEIDTAQTDTRWRVLSFAHNRQHG